MAESVLIQPDTEFVKDVIASGGGDFKKCFQCATCSVVCKLSTDDAPFPRRQMIEAQWGLKEKVLADPAVWLCHNCGECTTRCPRGAKPGEVLGALRSQAIAHYAWPGFLGRLALSPKGLPLLLALPVAVFAAVALFAPKGAPIHALEFASVFPVGVLEPLFFAVSGLVLLAFAIGVARFLRALRAEGARGDVLKGLVPALVEIASHKRFKDCGRERARRWGHLLVLFGFIGLAIMGTVVGVGTMAGLMTTPLALLNPLKIFANLCAAVILVGGLILLVDRFLDPAKRKASTYFDWLFLGLLVGVVATGILSELLRLAQAAPAMYAVYFVHLVLIFALFLYAPYTKFAHFVYRTVAMAAAGKQ